MNENPTKTAARGTDYIECSCGECDLNVEVSCGTNPILARTVEIKLSLDMAKPRQLRAWCPGFSPAHYVSSDRYTSFCDWWRLVGRCCAHAVTGQISKYI